MAQTKEIEVFLIARPTLRPLEVEKWLKCQGVSPEAVGEILEQIRGTYGEKDYDAENLVALAGKRCYQSFEPGLNKNVTRIRKELAEYLDNILASGHGSVLEHANFVFAIEGLTRVATAELNRHRAGVAISEGSLRYIRMDDLSWWLPPSLRVLESDSEEVKNKKRNTLAIFQSSFNLMESRYKDLCAIWEIDSLPMSQKKKLTSMFRRILGMGISTGGIWTFNVRALRHVITQRSSPGAEEEIALIAGLMCKIIREECPNLFGDFVQDEQGFWLPKYVKV